MNDLGKILNYFKIPELEHIYLEDSYVLSITERANSITFELEAVLTESHPFFLPPKKAEQYCYKKATLYFSEIHSIEWKKKNFRKFVDAAEDVDYGNIEVFLKENDQFLISGDWGEVVIKSETVSVMFPSE